MSETLLDPGAIEAIVGGYHGAPFDILGPHRAGDDLVIRAFLPEAESVGVVLGPGDPRPMERIHVTGLFEVTLPNQDIAPYRLAVTDRSGQTQLYEDPYSFTSTFGGLDAYLMGEGTHQHIYERLGAHIMELRGVSGVHFAVWAPNAQRVSVVGPFNQWDGRRHPMRFLHDNGVWELFIPGLGEGTLYKYEIKTHYQGYMVSKADPVGFASEMRPKTASVVWDIDKHQWGDAEWMDNRDQHQGLRSPISIYELHIGSWRRKNGWEWLTYRDLITELIPYVKELGYTHIELLPVAEHPSDNSWGYQVTGFYAPTSRYGTPDDFMAFVDACHQAGIGVILDWVPAHFPRDAFALAWFDGSHLYEHADPRQGEHRDWGTLIFNYGRHEVENFLIGNALFWLEHYHFDGLRVDAVASMLYLDYSRPKPGDWIPNKYGGRENLEAIEFLKHTNAVVHQQYPGVMMIAEESTSFPAVSRPTDQGGLGFGFKWNMGWMHDVLAYMKTPPGERRHHHSKLTFGLVYAFSENFVLSLSHDEVVHLKGSLLTKMAGREAEKLANLRLLIAFMYAHPGKKLLFMGAEFGQPSEWNHARGLEWDCLEDAGHRGVARMMGEMNALYRRERAFFEVDFKGTGFEWLDADSADACTLAFLRKARDPRNALVFVFNFSGISLPHYRVGVPYPVEYAVLFDTNAIAYGGCAPPKRQQRNIRAEEIPWHGRDYSIAVPLAAFSALILKPADADSRPVAV